MRPRLDAMQCNSCHEWPRCSHLTALLTVPSTQHGTYTGHGWSILPILHPDRAGLGCSDRRLVHAPPCCGTPSPCCGLRGVDQINIMNATEIHRLFSIQHFVYQLDFVLNCHRPRCSLSILREQPADPSAAPVLLAWPIQILVPNRGGKVGNSKLTRPKKKKLGNSKFLK